jgi:phospholipase/lecithinase/hemolysin
VAEYNPLLKSKLADLQKTLTGATIIWFDIYDLFKAVLTDPTAYKLVNVTEPAFTPDDSEHGGSVVPNPDQYLFWDTTHPTRVGHRIVAGAAYKAIISAEPAFGQMHRAPLRSFSLAKD